MAEDKRKGVSMAVQAKVMTEQEKKQRIAALRAELKELQATPRSDWHTAFEVSCGLKHSDTRAYLSGLRLKSGKMLRERTI